MNEELASLRAEMASRELARRSYKYYLSYVHGKMWKDTQFSSFLADKVQSFLSEETGNAYDILVIASPPQHGKSITITESLPSWVNGVYPEWRIIQASYNDITAERFCRRNKAKIAQYGKTLFGISFGQLNRSTEYELGDGHRGGMICRGMLSGITGNPAELVIIDDPIKNRQEADSPTTRSSIWNEWLNSIKSRLAAHAKIILIMTPWHEDDLRARILLSEKNVEYVRLPVEAEEQDPLGRNPGDPLCPEIGKDGVWLAQFKESYLSDPTGGARAWQALFQCSPIVESGNLVQRGWFKFYDPEEIKVFATTVISVDATFKDGEDNDYVAITVWGKLNRDYYLRYCLNRHLNFPDTVSAIRATKVLYPDAHYILIEDKANGSAIIQTLQKEFLGVIGINPKGGKVARVNAVSPAIESGHVFLPTGAPWVEPYLDQWTAFPAGAHDDMVDSSSQALHRLIFHTGTVVVEQKKTESEYAADAEQETFLDGSLCYNVY